MAERIRSSDNKRYNKLIEENKWDIIIPPLPREDFSSLKSKGITIIENWGNKFLEINFHEQLLIENAKRKVYVFVLDTAGSYDHDSLGPFTEQKLAKSFTGEFSLKDKHGHGTHCAGIICATHPEHKLGIARKLAEKGLLKIIPIKVLNDEGAGNYSWIKNAIDYIISLDIKDGVKVISMSLGGHTENSGIKDSINQAISKNIFIFCAAGNDGPKQNTINFPGRLDNVMAIGSLDEDGSVSTFSSRGEELDFMCPGRSIWSTYPGNNFVSFSGTSMATPACVAIGCWLLSIFPHIKNQQQLYNFFKKWILDMGVVGFDTDFGWGAPVITPYLIEIPGEEDPNTPIEKEKFNWKTVLIIGVIIILITIGILIFK